MFTSDDEFTDMIYTMKAHSNTDESLFNVVDFSSKFYSEINLLPNDDDGEFSIIDLNASDNDVDAVLIECQVTLLEFSKAFVFLLK